MIAPIAIAALLAAAVAASCGPSPNNYLVVRLNQPGSPTNGAAACAAFNMDKLDLTTVNAVEVSTLMYGCLGSYRNALIGSWNGVNYGVQCLEAFVTTSPTSIAVSALAACPPPQAVVCQQRGTQPIIMPSASVTSTTRTNTATATATQVNTDTVTYTLPADTTTDTLTETTTTTTTATNTIACAVGGASPYVYITQTVSQANAEALCNDYGMTLAYVDNLTTFSSGICSVTGATYWMRPTISRISGYAYGNFSIGPAGGQVSGLSVISNSSAIGAGSPNLLICQETNSTAGANVFTVRSYNQALSFAQNCQSVIPGSNGAVYPLDNTVGLPDITNTVAGAAFSSILPNFTAPASVSCALIQTFGATTVQYAYVTACTAPTANGVLCQLPQQVPPPSP